jgi:chemotaxis family two-component system response regulator Rcp1
MILVHVSRSSTPELHQRARSRAKLRAHDKEHLQVSTVVDSNAPHILLVEDNPADMRLTLEALKEAKVVCNLHWVKDGVEALDYLHRRNGHANSMRPDLILLDLNLPRLDGREVLAEIKAHPRLRRIPTVVLSTSKEEEDIVRCYDLHANCYVTKDQLNFDSFLEAIRSIARFWLSVVALPPRAHDR